MKSFFDLNYAVVGADHEAQQASRFASVEEMAERFCEADFGGDPLEILIMLEDESDEIE